MQVITKIIEYPSRNSKINIVPLGDIHLGVVHCDEDLLDAEVSKIKKDELARWVGIGDYGDLISPSDFKRWNGRILAPWMQGHEDNVGPTQCDRIHEILSPIWNKCLGLLEGNHEESMRRQNHYDLMEELLKRVNKVKEPYKETNLDVPYAGVDCFIQLNFKRGNPSPSGKQDQNNIIIHARHGEGHAQTSGARANAVLRLASTFVNANIVFMGHLHGQESPDLPQRLILRNGKIKSFDGIATMTGAWLKAYAQDVPPCYLERWGTRPSQLGCPSVIIEPDKEQMTLEKVRQIRTL